MRLLFTVVWGFLLVAGAAAQEDRGDAAAGLAYATNVCSECHAIAAGDHDSPNPDTRGFDDIANTRGISEMALASFFQTPHPTMPNLVVPSNDARDLIAYILSLKH